MFSGFDGKIFLCGKQELPWHGIKMRQSAIQCLPRILQKPSWDYNKVEKSLWYAHILLQQFRESPFGAIKRVIRRMIGRQA